MAGRSDSDNDIHLHLHLEPELFALRRAVHLHVHLEGGAAAAKLQESGRPYYLVAPCIREPKRASTGETTKVRVTDAGASICAYGRLDFDGYHPDEVWGQIFDPEEVEVCDPEHPSSEIPPSTGSSATAGQLVNFGSHPTFSQCNNPDECNFAFHEAYGNEIPGAGHSSSGVENCLVIWGRRGDEYRTCTVTFSGVTATEPECEPEPSPEMTAASFRQIHRTRNVVVPTYRVIPDESTRNLVMTGLGEVPLGRLLPDGPILLEYDPYHSIPDVPEWKTAGCSRSNGHWSLRQSRLGSRCVGTLRLYSVADRALEEPLEWQAHDWQFGRGAIFQPRRPPLLVDAQATCTVEPQ